jgi:hypothetical protein
MAELRTSPYYWKYDGAQIEGEFRPPLATGATAPDLGKGAQRANPTTGAPEYWDGTEWKATGEGVGGDTVSGTYSTTGNGLTAVFTWPHGLGFNPTSTGFTIDPRTPAAQGIYQKTADATDFNVYYDICPIGSLIFNTTAKTP